MFIGNEKAVNFLKRCVEKEKISQAYLFSGPSGLGKFTLAKIFARSIINRENFTQELIAEKNPFDLLIIEPEIEDGKNGKKEKEIKIEKIREIKKDLALFPYEGKFKVLIINNAHKMNVSAQNALLKLLEEPNPTSIIILITHEENEILPTIKSRCQKINFFLVASENLEKGLAKEGYNLKDKDELIYLSLGRPGKAVKMIDDDSEYEQKKGEADRLHKIIAGGTNSRLEIAGEMADNFEKTIEILELWLWILRVKADENYQARMEKIIAIEKIEKTLSDLKNTNANAKMAIENLLINF